MKDEPTLVEVFCGNNIQVGFVKSLLENAEIQTYIKDEIMGTMNPWWTSPGGAGSISIFVSTEDEANAQQIVQDFERSLKLDEDE